MITNKTIETIKTDLQRCEALVDKYKKTIKFLPAGSIHSKLIRGKKYYYHYLPASKGEPPSIVSLVSKEKESLRNNLIKKKFYSKSIVVLENNILAMKLFLYKYKLHTNETLLDLMPINYRNITRTVLEISPETEGAHPWQHQIYDKNPFHTKNLKIRAQNGMLVRSKSEAIILGQLETFNIPYRYEAKLVLGEISYFPDFTILNPRDNSLIYWEHFGMADDDEYSNSMRKKLEIYSEYDIVQWSNLITTFETESKPLNAQTVNNLIRAFLTSLP